VHVRHGKRRRQGGAWIVGEAGDQAPRQDALQGGGGAARGTVVPGVLLRGVGRRGAVPVGVAAGHAQARLVLRGRAPAAHAAAVLLLRRPGRRRRGLLAAILPRITLHRRPGGSRTTPACPSWSSTSWSSSSSNTSSTMSPVFTVQSSPAVHVGASRGHHGRAISAGGAYDEATPRCFSAERECYGYERRVVKGCGVAVALRNALATVVVGKPGRRAATSAAA
jgi:hypothetical protein